MMTSALLELKLHPFIDYLSNVTAGMWYCCNEKKLLDFPTFENFAELSSVK